MSLENDRSIDLDAFLESLDETESEAVKNDPAVEELQRQNKELQDQLAAKQKWIDDISRYKKPQDSAVTQTPENKPDDDLVTMVNNPKAFVQNQIQPIVEEFNQKMDIRIKEEAMVRDFEQKHPELLPYRQYIALEVQQLMAQNNIEYLSPQLIDAGIKAFKEKLPQSSKQNSMQQNAMNLDINRSSSSFDKPKTKIDFKNMPEEQFLKLMARVSRGDGLSFS